MVVGQPENIVLNASVRSLKCYQIHEVRGYVNQCICRHCNSLISEVRILFVPCDL